MAHLQFVLASGRRIGVSVLGDPLATRLVVLCLPTPGAGPFDPDPAVTAGEPIRLVEIDRPGYGASDPLPEGENPTIERLADDIAEYLASVRTDARELTGFEFGPAAVIGWSFGAAVAVALATRHPNVVDRLVIVAAPTPRRIRSGERFSAISELRKRGVERSFGSLKSSLDDDGQPGLLALAVDDRDPALTPLGVRGRLERMLESSWTQDSAGITTDRLAVRKREWLDAPRQVRHSTLLVYGGADVLATEKDAGWYARSIRGAQRLTVPEAGHLVVITAWAQILRWASSGEAAPRGEADPQLGR